MAEQDNKEYIFEPLFSRPFNIAVWTEDPALVGLVSEIWQQNFAQIEAEKKGGKKPARPYIEQLRILIADLYLAWHDDPNFCLGMPFSEGAWDSRSRYNPLNLSKSLVKLVHHLAGAGLVRVSPGSYGGPGAKGNRTSRIQASWGLQQRFSQLAIQADAIQEVPRECIILKAGEEGEESREIDYTDTDDTRRMRAELEAYNDLLNQTFIDIPTLDEPWIRRFDKQGQELRVTIGRRNQLVRRIFSRGSWTMNGRFYGPWWQNLSSELRSQIFINDTPTVEIDFKAMHIQILAALEGVEVDGDPYELPPGQFSGVDEKEQRDLVKLLVLTALNAKSRKVACAAFRSNLPTGHSGKHLKDKEIEIVLDALTGQTPWLGEHLGKDQGIALMYKDSRIIEGVINRCTRAGFPVLTVHDSIIVPYTQSVLVKGLMRAEAAAVLGREVPLESKHLGLAEYRDKPLSIQRDFEAWRETERSRGYLDRLSVWENRMNRVVVPYRVEQQKKKEGEGHR